MTPTNTQMTPEIENIMDNEDVKHTVVPTPHSHSQNEVDGLVDALAAKANAQHHHASIYETKGVQTAIVSTVQDPEESNTTYIQLGFQDDREEEFYQYASISLQNLNNLKRVLLNPDSTPTADSDNLVTSGGVKAAIDDVTKAAFVSSMPYIITAMYEKMRVYTRILSNKSGVTMTSYDCLDFSTLPPAERENIFWNTPSVDIAPNESFGIRFMRFATGVYVWYDGKFEY